MHIAKSGKLIIKTNRELNDGTVLIDFEGKKVARVHEIFGPTRSPYASTQLLTDQVKKLTGGKVYLRAERPRR